MEDLDIWRNYFDRQLTLKFPVSSEKKDSFDKFNVYMAGSVHNNILICLHGAGHTALSWSLLAKSLRESFCVVAYDCRGHGLTECIDSFNLRTEVLVKDGINIIREIQNIMDKERKTTEKPVIFSRRVGYHGLSHAEFLVREKILSDSRHHGPPVILMGHSMGGAMAIHLAFTGEIANLQGLIILDVVEGTVFEALPVMDKFISSFPISFDSLKSGIDWSLKNILSNPESAIVSIPSQLKFDGKTWRWRVDLKATKPFWNEWFLGIGNKFLLAPIPSGGKVLVLVGHERLDKPLTIAQMQGKFQLTVIPKSGHIVQEDQPEDVVRVVLSFAERYCLLKQN